MTGRDYRTFLFKSRTNPEGLLVRLRTEPIEKIIPSVASTNEYEMFDMFCKNMNIEQEKDKIRVRSMKMEQDNFRDIRLRKQHQATWAREWSKLQLLEKQIMEELMELPLYWHANDLDEEIDSIMELEKTIASEYKTFYEETVLPMLMLRWDLQFWHNAYLVNENYGQGEASAVYKIIDSVHDQRNKIIDTLENEADNLEISESLIAKSKSQFVDSYQGIPESVNFNTCPDHLMASLKDEFIILDIKYQHKLTLAKERHDTFIRSRFGGWIRKEHELFKHVMELYPSHLANCHELMFDLLHRLMPHYTLDDLLMHQTWINYRRRYKDTLAAILSDWQRSKNELAVKAETIIFRAHKIVKENSQKAVAFKKQQALCYDLYMKVVQWRQWKLQKLLLDEERENRRFVEEKQRDDLAEQDRRLMVKKTLEVYHQERKVAADDQQHKLKFEALKVRKARMEQTLFNKERIKYRESLRIANVEQQKTLNLQRLKKEDARQKKLEKLRLAVEVQADPWRLHQNTRAFEAKQKHEYEDDPIPSLKPLFQVYGFTDEELAADPRTRLEAKLREANMVHLPYAQEVLQKLKPPTVPRKDMTSSIRFEDC